MNNSKTFHRGSVLTAFCLAVLFALQAVCALLPACIVRAASSDSVEIWDEDKKVDYGYRFSMKFQPGVSTWTEKLFRIMEKVTVIPNAFV